MSAKVARLQHYARIIMIHGVGGSECPTDAFIAQLNFLSKNFRIVTLDELTGKLRAGKPIGEATVVLTFDDGLLNNATVAYPILKRMGIPATFYVCPALVERRQWLWNHACRARLQGMDADRRRRYAAEIGAGDCDTEAIVERMKCLPATDRFAAQTLLEERTPEFTPTPEQRNEYESMGWEELTALDPELITIGSHSATHAILTRLTGDGLAHEVCGGRALLEQRLGRPVRHFCYPNGAYDSNVLNCVRQHFDSAVTTETGFVRSKSPLHELPRIPVADDAVDLTWRMHRPDA